MGFKVTGYKDCIEINYFGFKLHVPPGTVAVATDGDGQAYAYGEIPRCITEGTWQCWSSASYANTKLDALEFSGNWQDSLLLLDPK